ncbi:hypothetical protein YC2023_042401 [Brassica napus]
METRIVYYHSRQNIWSCEEISQSNKKTDHFCYLINKTSTPGITFFARNSHLSNLFINKSLITPQCSFFLRDLRTRHVHSSLLIFYHFIIKKHSGYVKKTLFQSYPWNWPVFGMLPGVLLRLSRIDDIIWVLEKNNLTFSFKGPWFARMDMLFTVDPANIQHMLSSNFSNYNKGPEFKELIDVFGGSILIADGELWKNLRMSSQAILSRQGFQNMSMSVTTSKLKDVLLPLFSRFSEDGTILDLQEVFQRFMFDTTLVTTIGSDPQSLSTEMPELELAKALENAGEAIVFRHFIPRFMWKFQTWMGLGQAKKLIDAGATFDRVCVKYILAKREEIRSQEIDHHQDHPDGESEDVLTYFMKLDTSKYELLKPSDDKFLRDTIVASILAMRDTTSTALTWFFWLISENPYVEAKIRQEINKNLPKSESSQERSCTTRKQPYSDGHSDGK